MLKVLSASGLGWVRRQTHWLWGLLGATERLWRVRWTRLWRWVGRPRLRVTLLIYAFKAIWAANIWRQRFVQVLILILVLLLMHELLHHLESCSWPLVVYPHHLSLSRLIFNILRLYPIRHLRVSALIIIIDFILKSVVTPLPRVLGRNVSKEVLWFFSRAGWGTSNSDFDVIYFLLLTTFCLKLKLRSLWALLSGHFFISRINFFISLLLVHIPLFLHFKIFLILILPLILKAIYTNTANHSNKYSSQ